MIKKVLTHPTKSLRQKSIEIEPENIRKPNFQKLLDDMAETMINKDGIGLAAPQIGKNVRVIVINTKDGIIPLINPIILSQSLKKESEEEGCLSVPGVYGIVSRPFKIKVQAYDFEGVSLTLDAKGLLARVIQHEIDHLDGILFIDKAKKTFKKEKL
jgi:peptide deformylase